jgi:hypothetical protein
LEDEHMKRIGMTLAFGLLALGCGGGGGGGNGGGGGGGPGDIPPKVSSSSSCCLNGSYYKCPSDSAATDCFNNFSPGSCGRDSSKDNTCPTSSSAPEEEPAQ